MPQIDPKHRQKVKPVAQGISASPGAAVGKVVLSAEAAIKEAAKDPKARLMLVRKETSPEDVAGMHLAQGILTSTGGKASHAAVVARGWGKPCVVGCEAIKIDEAAGTITVKGQTIKAGDYLTIDGSTGEVWAAEMPTVDPDHPRRILHADGVGRQGPHPQGPHQRRHPEGLRQGPRVRRRGDRPVPDRAHVLRRAADRRHAEDDPGRRRGRAARPPSPSSSRSRSEDFIGIFEAMDGLPVTIRLLDPPLHEFLPHDEKGQAEVASQLGVSLEKVRDRVEQLHEFNPMLGFRGCRLPIVYPEIGDMQVRAIIQAAIEVQKRGKTVLPEIMIPLVGDHRGADVPQEAGDRGRRGGDEEGGREVEYQIGTMIEVPRAALTADQIAEEAEFFSFGTNDLTQMTFGFSRDDIKGFMPTYLKEKILPIDPFQTPGRQGGRPVHRDRRDQGPQGPPGEARRAPEGRNLRRARRRPRQRRLLPQGGDGLRLLLAVPRPDRPAGRRPGRPGQRRDDQPG